MKVLLLLYCFIILSLCEEDKHSSEKKNVNVVLFFTHVDTKCASLQEDSLGFLKLYEATRVKHCSNEFETIGSGRDKADSSSYCKELLKENLVSLTHFCHTVLKMKTAIASVSSKEMTTDIQEPESPFHPPHISFHTEAKDKRSIKMAPIANPGHKKIITGAKHTEVFQIRIKRNARPIDTTAERDIKIKIVDDVPTEKPTKKNHPWDVLDILKHIRYSFLGKLFEDTLQDQLKADQEDVIDISQLGKERLDPGLFSMVKSTLDTLLEPPDVSFLFVVFGGHLHAVGDKHSPIVQSIKYVVENTEEENTLIIVTGSCGEETEESKEQQLNTYNMPVYAKGPTCGVLSKCGLLYDIPLAIKQMLATHSGIDLGFSESTSN